MVPLRKAALLLSVMSLVSCEAFHGELSGPIGPVDQPGNFRREKRSHRFVGHDLTAIPQAEPLADGVSPNWKPEGIDSTIGADYLANNQRAVILEINRVRADPAAYANNYLEPMKKYYQGLLLRLTGKHAILTAEGVSALEECIRELKKTKPLYPLSPRKGLTLAARDHVEDQAATGAIGHTGSDGSTMATRLDRHGWWNISAGENIFYGFGDAQRIVAALLIDDGVPGRGHRKNLLNPGYRLVGVELGPHRVHGEMCVMDFAGSYSDKPAITRRR